MRTLLCIMAIIVSTAALADEPTIFAYRSAGAFNLYLYQGSIGIPSAVTVDSKNQEVWVADTSKDLLAVFATNGVSLFASASEKVQGPQRIALTPSGELLVIEGKRNLIRRFSYRGEYRGDLELEQLDAKAVIGAIAVDGDGTLYVGENLTGQVKVYNTSGKLRFQFGSRGAGEGQFLSIVGIAVDPTDGTIWIADQQGVPVQAFDNQGNFVIGWGRHETGRENFGLPSGIAVNSKGLVIVSDELRHDLKTFDRKGNVVQLFGGQGAELGALSFPTAIAVGADDRLYVAERGNRRVQIYDLVEAPAPRQR